LITEINKIADRINCWLTVHGTSIYLILLTLRRVRDFIMIFLKSSSIILAAFLLLYLVGTTAGGKLKYYIILWLFV